LKLIFVLTNQNNPQEWRFAMSEDLCSKDLGLDLPILRKWDLGWDLKSLRVIFSNAFFFSATDSMLCNNRRVFIALSGGIDSSYCVAALRMHLGNDCPIDTFTVGSSEQHPDVVHAKMVAELFHTEPHCLIPTEKQVRQVDLIRTLHPELFAGDKGRSGYGVFLLMQSVKEYARRLSLSYSPALITHDGIDELLGGYWDHRKFKTQRETEKIFETLWRELPEKHLIPLKRKADFHGVIPLHPYLHRSVVEYISHIPVGERTSRKESKIPLRRLAERFLPREIIERRKLGFCDAMESVAELEKRH